jgi:hypothetical protein
VLRFQIALSCGFTGNLEAETDFGSLDAETSFGRQRLRFYRAALKWSLEWS